MKIDQLVSEKCTGCSVCVAVCPKHCIAMVSDNEGFLYPKIDYSQCIDCGLCAKICPSLNISKKDSKDSDYPKFYTSAIKDKYLIKKSSSGGLFIAFAKYFLQEGGYVCGCVFNEDMKAIHICTNELNKVMLMCGSKYVQSELGDTFYQIKKLLLEGKKVLFTGTACQVIAIKRFLKKPYNNLFTMDILCHGVPSPLYLKYYVDYLEKKHKGKLIHLEFRNKDVLGWGSEHRIYYKVRKNNKIIEARPKVPSYFCAFFWGINLRPSCYKCDYTGINRISDITIGDFWGYWPFFKKKFKDGISIACVNTKKGNDVYLNLSKDFSFNIELEKNIAMGSNTNFYHPTRMPKTRESFYNDIDKKDYRKLMYRIYFDSSSRRKLLVTLYGRFIPERFKNFRHEFIKTICKFQ